MGTLIFVTTELHPFTPGGIGRVLCNMLMSMSEIDRARALVLLIDVSVGEHRFKEVFGSVRLFSASTEGNGERYRKDGFSPTKSSYSDTIWHWRSIVVLRELQSIAEKEEIDYVEFADFGGLGFATLQEKRISGFLAGTTLSVRLHSASAVILATEAQSVRISELNLIDLERKCLRDCDLIVGQLGPTAESIRLILGIDEKDWSHKLLLHSPPVLLSNSACAVSSNPASLAQPIAFVSKLQSLKRPDVFIRGVSGFIRNGEFTGNAVLCAHSFDKTYENRIKRLIPSDIQTRFVFAESIVSEKREQLIATSVAVFPSIFESFCLAAYEASFLGARVVLNGINPAFGEGTPWVDGVNCFKFDGTPAGLVDCLARCFKQARPLEIVENATNSWPWLAHQPQSRWKIVETRPLVSIVITNFNLGAYLPETLASIVAQSYSNIEVIVVDDCSTDVESKRIIDELKTKETARFKVLQPITNIGLGAARNFGIARTSGSYVVSIDADDLIRSDFIQVCVSALENNPEYDILVSPAGYFSRTEEIPKSGEKRNFASYHLFTGESVASGMLENRFSTATAMFRRSVFDRFSYDEELSAYEDWGLYLRLVDAGVRFIVASDVMFFYRRRVGSMIHVARSEAEWRIIHNDLLRTSSPGCLKEKFRYLALVSANPMVPISGRMRILRSIGRRLRSVLSYMTSSSH